MSDRTATGTVSNEPSRSGSEGTAAELVPGAAITASLAGLYRELLEGMPAGEPTWITNGGPEGGLYGTVSGLTAEQASRELDGTTAAAHTEHVRWAMQLVNDHFDGVEPTSNWSESWKVKAVEERAWAQLRDDLREVGELLLTNLTTRQRWNEGMNMQGALASFGHTAYHVGAVRQLAKRLQDG